MYKRLHVKIDKVCYDTVIMRVTEQSHRGSEFGDEGSNSFFAFNSRRSIASAQNPSCGRTTLFVRGNNKSRDDDTFSVELDECMDLLLCILSYNKHYNKNKLELSDVVEGLEILEESNE